MKLIITLVLPFCMLLAAILGSVASTNAQSTVNDIAVVGDWDGDGIATPGVFRTGVWYLHNSNTPSTDYDVQPFAFGHAGDRPVVGDWDRDGKDTPGVVRIENGALVWYLHNSNTSMTDNDPQKFGFGLPGDRPVVGDWNRDGYDTPGVVRQQRQALVWYLRNSNDTGPASIPYFGFGLPGDQPVVGDWDRDGFDTVGVVRQQGQALVWYLRNSNDTGPASIPYFGFGLPGDQPVAGDWDGDRRGGIDPGSFGTDTAGVMRNGMWYLRNSNDTGGADISPFAFPKVTIVDINFRPRPNGYSFANYGRVNMADYTIDDMRRSFGDNAVCASIVNGHCIARFAAQQWNIWANQHMSGGRCYGMAVTSLRFFKGIDTASNFQNGAATPYDLQQANARRNIAYYFVRQYTEPTSRSLYQGLQKTPAEVLATLQGTMSNGTPDPAVLVIAQAGGHAITPYAIEDRGNSIFWIKVYDNNWPNDDNRHVVINTATNTWSYDLGWMTWSGNASTRSIGIEQISNDGASPVCPWCQQSGANTTATSQIWSTGRGNLLVVDDQGRRVGNVGAGVVAEIPGSYVMPVIGGLGKAQSIYSVPLSGTHTLLIDGQTLTQTVTTAVAQFGPGYAVTADGITLKPAAQGKLTVAADGREATYLSSDATSVNLTLALDNLGGNAVVSNTVGGSNNSYTFHMNNVDVGGNQSVKATVDAQSGVVALSNEQTGGGNYDLQIRRATSAGEQSFAHAAIPVTAGDTQYIEYAQWNGSGDIVVKTDHGSDGTIDQTLTLVNTANRVYLPMVVQ